MSFDLELTGRRALVAQRAGVIVHVTSIQHELPLPEAQYLERGASYATHTEGS